MSKIIPVMILALCLTITARAEIIGIGIDSGYCESIFYKVENIAGCKAKGNVTVIVQESLESGLAVPVSHNALVLGMYEQDRRVVTIVRDYLCPWLLAHEFAHVVYMDNYSFHPESWVNVTADVAIGKKPKWLKMINEKWE